MKQILILMLVALASTAVNAQTKSKALVLGTYHMENPGLDKFNMKADDIGTPKRQEEVETFVNLLTSFKPTKICLEYPYAKREKLNDNYAAADLVADWYKRNLRIHRNILNIEHKPEDRFFILFGSGHSKILQNLIEDSAGFELVQLKDLK